MLVQVQNTSFVRDTESMALVNTDSTAKNEYLAKVRLLKNQKEEINNLELDEFLIKKHEIEIINRQQYELKKENIYTKKEDNDEFVILKQYYNIF